MFNYTKHTLKKFETLFTDLEYTIRYEKGNFQSGYAIVENRKIVVINKFYDTEARINTLLDILSTLALDPDSLSEASHKFFKQIRKDINAVQSEEEE